MTRWGVERTPRTAHRPSPFPPAGASALMPPPSQGAERRTERHAARRAGNSSRWGLRALVIGGLAGAAWLLTGAAAHAADGDHALPVVTQVLDAAARPPESSHHAHERQPGSIVRIPDLVQMPVLDALIEVTNGSTDADSALGEVTRVVRDLTAPTRPTGGPPDSRSSAPVSAPVSRDLRPAVDVVPSAATSQPVAAVGSTATHEKPHNAALVQAPGSHAGATDRHHAAAEADAPEAVRATPAGDEPTPLQGYLGVGSGIPAVGSGAPTEGRSAAFLPVAVGEHAVASHRLPPATRVDARHQDAGAPTVSPD